jgi:methylated-DNA-[protein]-cysteine S-methyltransferase
MTHYAHFESPVGTLLLTAAEDRLTGLYLPREERAPDPSSEEGGAFLDEVQRQLRAYFAGEREAFDMPVAPIGTAWQRRVWDELARIPYGQTISYAELARRAENPSAIRAAGAANGRNPISIVIPCHRVIGADGTLTGYSGGLDAKRWLLAHEGVAAC